MYTFKNMNIYVNLTTLVIYILCMYYILTSSMIGKLH